MKTSPTMPHAPWFKSSYSGSNNDNCVEVAGLTTGVGVRDSKDLAKGHLVVSRDAWGSVIEAVAR
ncbi:hypothetical protein GCM10023205_25520 [Yinghuangia aomiensis]|uniref:DUF397 domain-containing protein n=1 Tax=Yinghuangia aomiensis TaxID=676205 RepID=A0ABP9H5Q6_9ACTN